MDSIIKPIIEDIVIADAAENAVQSAEMAVFAETSAKVFENEMVNGAINAVRDSEVVNGAINAVRDSEVVNGALNAVKEIGLVNRAINAVTDNETVTNVVDNGSWFINNEKIWYFLGGVALGAFFGFRVGVVSGRARDLVEGTAWMKGAAVNSYDGIKAITVGRIEVPKLVNDNDVLVEVKAASLDPIDIKVSQGYGRGLRDLVNRYNPNTSRGTFPVILGRDGTGVVSEVGAGVHNLAVGDKVWFIVPPCYQGSLSSFLLLSSEYIRPLPKSLTFESGATLPYTGLVAWDLLVTSGGLGPNENSKGKRVFIWGGVRALERLSVQLCKVWGCEVTCVAPVYTHDYLRSLGASLLLDDNLQEIKKLINEGFRYDVVVNTAGLLAEDLCLSLSSTDGRVVTTLTAMPGLIEYGLWTSIFARMLNCVLGIFKSNLVGEDRKWVETRFTGEVLDYLGKLVDQGEVDAVGERIYSIDQVELAFKCLAGGGHRGKLVIRMDSADSSLVPWK